MVKNVKSSLLLLVLFVIPAGLLAGCYQSNTHDTEAPKAIQADLDVTKQVGVDSLSFQLFSRVILFAEENQLKEQPLGIIIQRVGQWFMESPYVAGTLDQYEEERLVIKLDGFDCVTFVESTVAISRTIQAGAGDLSTFSEKLIEQRYRDSVVDGYCSRLHYFSEWIYRNEEKGLVNNISKEIGGKKLEKNLDFMSNHRDSYPLLAANDELYAELKDVEKSLDDLEIFYIPQSDIRSTYDKLQPGDIIALATDIEGLDVVHTGFVYKTESGGTGLLHASTSSGVTVSPDLQDYVENNRRQIGILVARPIS